MDEHTAEDWFEKGKNNSKEKNSREAIHCYKQAVKMDPNFYYAWVNMAAEYFGMGDNKRTIDCCEHAIYLNPDDTKAWTTMGAAYWKMDEDGRALYCFNKAISLGDEGVRKFMDKSRIRKDRIIFAREENVVELMKKKRKSSQWEEFISLSDIKKQKDIEEYKLKELMKAQSKLKMIDKEEYIFNLSGLIIELLEDIESETGGTISVTEFFRKFREEYPKNTANIDDILAALEYLAEKKLILGIKELSSGIKIIDAKPVEFTDDLERVLIIFKNEGNANISELMEETGWDIIRCTKVLKSLEEKNLAKKVSSFSEGERWYFVKK